MKPDAPGMLGSGTEDGHRVTMLLEQVSAGDAVARSELLDLIYHTIQKVAEAQCAAEAGPRTLDANSLVNEAYLRVFGREDASYANRRHLFGAFANAMREVLVDAARRRQAAKRNHGRRPLPLLDAPARLPALDVNVLDLETVLPAFERSDPRAAEVARLKCYASLSDETISELLNISPRSVQREWLYARAALRKLIDREAR